MMAALVMWLFLKEAAAVLLVLSSLLYTWALAKQQPQGKDVTQRRLLRQQLLGGVMLIMAGLLMLNQELHLLRYFHHNEWMIALAIGCLLQVYTSFRLPATMIVVLMLASCSETYKIEGSTTLDAFEGETLYLKVQDGANREAIDSCTVHHGFFTFKGKRDSVEMAFIYYNEQNVMPVMLDGGNIQVELSETVHTAKGSAMNDSLFAFIDRKALIDQQIAQLPAQLSRRIMEGEDIDLVQRDLARENMLLSEEADREIVAFIKHNIANAMGLGMFQLVTSDLPYPVLTPEVEEIFATASGWFMENAYVREYNQVAENNMLLMREGKQPEQM